MCMSLMLGTTISAKSCETAMCVFAANWRRALGIVPRSRATRNYSGQEVLGLYLKRPRAKSWDSRRCVGALRIQRLEGSRPRGLWDLYLDEPVLVVCEFAVAVRALGL